MRSLVLIALLFLPSCREQQPAFPAHRPGEVDPATAANLTARDMEVYEAVIAAYAQNGQVMGIGKPPGPRQALSPADIERLSTEYRLRMHPYTHIPYEVGREETGWFTLGGEPVPRLVIHDSMVRDFNTRNRRRISLDRFRPKHLRVIRATEIETMRPLLVLTLPGYSMGGNAAVVEISVAFASLTGGGELIFLRRTGTTWQVVAKRMTWIS